jgi:urease accessory protein
MRVLDLILADARTPTGGYAHSAGLEQLVANGADSGAVPAFAAARLRTVAWVEAAFAARACAQDRVPGLLELDQELAARTPAPPLRQASGRLGSSLLRTALRWWPQAALLLRYQDRSELTLRPVALGAVVRCGGGDPLAAATISLYEDAATVCSAAVKLLPLDPALASRWMVLLAHDIETLSARATVAAEGPELPSTATPSLDRDALVHSEHPRRLFAS